MQSFRQWISEWTHPTQYKVLDSELVSQYIPQYKVLDSEHIPQYKVLDSEHIPHSTKF